MPTIVPFNQPAPALGNQYSNDRVLRSFLRRFLPEDVMSDAEPDLQDMGELSGGELYQKQQEFRLYEPRHIPFDAWGNRIDHIEVSPFWKECERLAAEKGIVAASYNTKQGEYARIVQFALCYLFHPSTDVYTCPLAMTDGAARTLLRSQNTMLIERAVPRLTSRNPQEFWTSGQWMTESTGGSDVGQTETLAEQDENGVWRLYGRKWFTSAITSQMALTLARPVGNPPKRGDSLALFYVETRTLPDGASLNNITVHRLKEKLGTKKLPTAELTLNGTVAHLVYGTQHGIRNIVPMLHITRTWNSVCAIGFMRRALALARDYARKRFAFGAYLSEKPLHAETLADLQAEFEAAFHLVMYGVRLLGKEEAGVATEDERTLFRALSSVIKLTTGKQAVALTSEALECFGGAGYVEDTGLPVLLRDSQVLSIWEGTTNVLSLDALKAIILGETADTEENTLECIRRAIQRCTSQVRDERLIECVRASERAFARVSSSLHKPASAGKDEQGDATQAAQSAYQESLARRIALTIGRSLALALLAEHAEWSLHNEGDGRARAAACRFARAPLCFLPDDNEQGSQDERAARLQEAFLLANDAPLL